MTGTADVPPALYTAAQCRALDRLAIEVHGLPGFELMLRAGRAAWRELIRRWPDARRLTVVCGSGNNAGDGYVIAALARQAGLGVTLYQVGDPAALTGDAARARDFASDKGVHGTPDAVEALAGDVIVDALLGTGIRGELRPAFAAAARAINAAGCPVLAVDLPSGVSADTGAAAADAVRATLTVTFIGRKLGLHTGAGAVHAGAVCVDDLGVPSRVYRQVAGCPWLEYQALGAEYRVPPRDAAAYKHALGHVVVVGGDRHMGGAPLMAAEAALRAGAGMVSVITRASHSPAILARRPEVMVADADDPALRATVLGRADVLLVGPGLGRDDWGRALLDQALALGRPTVLDADALSLLADRGPIAAAGPLVITPHAGEAARLLGLDAAAVNADRPAAALALARRVAGTAVLKGAGTLIASQQSGADPVLLGLCSHGNPGMASAGMGDVLGGLIAAVLGQGLDPPAAAVSATCLHGAAADRAVSRVGQRSLLATDLLPEVVTLLAEEQAAEERQRG